MKVTTGLVLASVALLTVALGQAEPPQRVMLYPGVAHNFGFNGTAWRSQVVLHNPGAVPVTALLELLPLGSSSVSGSREITVAAAETVVIDDLYTELAAGSGAGMLRLTGDIRAWVRTYNLGPSGTFGHDVPPVSALAGLAAGNQFAAPIFTPADLATDPRSNLLLVNLEDREITVQLRDGASTAEVAVPARSYVQVNLVGDLLGNAPGVDTLRLTADGRWGGYITTIDPHTGDPTAVRPLAESYSSYALFAGVADTVGVNQTHWRSEATLYNANPNPTGFAWTLLELIPRGGSLPTAVRTVYVAPLATVHLADVYGELGADPGAGMLRVSGVLAWVRTFNARPDGTCGQNVPELPEGSGFAAGQGIVMPFYAPADIQQDFRSNLVLVNFDDTTTELTLSAAGAVETISLAPGTYLQIDNLGGFLQAAGPSASGVAAAAGGQLGAVTITGDGRWGGYVTTIDPLTGDPTTVEGLPVVDDAAANRPPEAVDDVVVVSKNVAKTLDVLANDADPDGDPLSVSVVVSPPQHGSATVIGGGSITYQPDVGFEGADAFTYGVSDGRGGSDTAVVTIDVVNDPPVAFPATITTSENSAYAGTLSGNDPNGDPLTFTKVSDPTYGVVTILADGDFVYTPAGSFSGYDSFTFRVSDGSLQSNVATITVLVTSVNDPPLAVADAYAVDEDTPLSVAAPGVLGNDGDPDGDALSAIVLVAPTHAASFALAPNGSFSYVPAADYNGPDGFSYFANDGRGGSSTAAVTITVRPVNDPPVASPGTVTTVEDVAAPLVLSANDADGDPLTYLIVFGPSHGSLAGVAPNLTYTPAPDYHGSDQVIFAASDGLANSNTATISLTVAPASDAPVGVSDVYGTAQGVSLTVVAPGVLDNDLDADGDALSAVLVAGPSQAASFALGPDGSFDYTPQPAFSGTDSFTYRASDGVLTSAPVTVAINVRAGNTTPVANPATVTTGEDTPAAVTLTGTDADGDALSFAIATSPAHGTLVGTPPNLTYVPGSDYAGPDGFTFTVSDGLATSAPAAISITVDPVNEAPVGVSDVYGTDQGVALSVVAPGVVGNDADPDGDALSAVLVAGPLQAASFVLAADGSFDYAPQPVFSGTDSFTYRASDGTLTSAPVTVAINVRAGNTPPAGIDRGVATNEDAPVAVTLTGFDADGDALSFAIATSPAHGTLVGTPPNLTFVPAADYAGPDSFTFTVSDGFATSAPATISITVNPVNDAPVMNGATFSVAENSANGTVVGTVTFSDPDAGQGHTFAITAGNTAGSFAIGATSGQLTVANGSLLDFETTPSFVLTVQVTDDGVPPLSGTATVTVDLTNANDAPVVDGATFSVAENSANGTVVGTATFSDPDTGQAHAFAITGGNTGGAFAIGAVSGEITVANQAALDFDVTPSFVLAVEVTDDGSPPLSGTATVTVNLTDANDAPVVNAATFSVAENSANGAAVGTATFTDPDAGQTHGFAITAGNTNGAFAIGATTGQITVANSAALDFETTPSFSLTVEVTDDGVPPLSGTATVTVNLTDANEAPVVNAATFSVAENSANGTAVGTVTFSDPDAGQTHGFAITAGNTAGAFAIGAATGQITVANGAALDFETTPSFALTVQVTDDGAPAQSGTATVTVNLTNANDAPVVDAVTFSVAENSANGTAVGTVTFSDPDTGQAHSFAITAGNTGGAFATNPATGQLTVANSLALNFEVTASFSLTVQVTDNGTPPLSGTATVTMNLTNVPEPPIVTGESYQTIGNTLLEVDAAPAAAGPKVVVSGSLLANDVDPDGPTVLSASLESATPGAVVSVDTDGTFTYLPPPGASGSDSFVYRVSDGVLSSTGTVTINFVNRVWYVRNNAASGGLGRSADPFDTLAEAQAASVANDYLFVHFGDGTTSGQDQGIALKSGQHLIGEHAGLSIPVGLNGAPSPTVLVAAAPGSRPLLDDTVAGAPEGVAATDAVPAEIVGLSLAGSVNAIDLTLNAGFGGSGTLSISQNVFRSAGAEGVDVNQGGSGTLTLDVEGNAWTTTAASHVGNAVDIRTTLGTLNLALSGNGSITSSQTAVLIDGSGGGTLNITGFAGNSVHQNTGGAGISVSSARFDQTPGGSYQQVGGGATVVGTPGDGVGGAALVLANVTGDLAFTDLDLFASSGAAFSLTGNGAANIGAGTGTRVTAGSGVGIFDAIGGPAVSVSGATVDLQLTTLTSLNSTTTGVSLTNVADASNPFSSAILSAGSLSSITNATGTDFAISGGNATVSFTGTITDDVGQLVSVASQSADTVTFSGAIGDGNDGDGSGISLANNTGATIAFSGGLSLSTGANAAFTATGGGTVTVTGSANTLATTTGTALNVQNTTIGAAGVSFRSISSNGAASGIVLNNTGSSGGLTVSGTGSAGSGGTIRNATGDGIVLTTTRDVSLSWMNVQSGQESGIFGNGVTNFTLSNCSVTNNGNDALDEGIRLVNLWGTAAITNVTVTGSAHNNLWIANSSGTLSSLSVSGSTFSSSGPTFGNDGFLFDATGTATVTSVSISGSTFSNNKAMGLQVLPIDTSVVSAFTVSNCTFTGNNIAIDFSQGGTANLTFSLLNNTTITGSNSHAINVFTAAGAGTGGTVNGRIQGNAIGNAGDAGSGSAIGNGVRINVNGGAHANMLVDGNTIRQCPNGRGVEAIGRNGTGGLDITVTNNDVDPQDSSGFPLAAILVQSNALTVANTVRSDVRGNVVPAGSTTDLLPTYLALVESSTSTLQLIDTPPASADCTAQLTGNNTGSASASAGCSLIAGPIGTPP